MALDQLPCFPRYSPEGVEGASKEFGGQIAKAFSLHSMLEWLVVERVRTRLREAGWKGDDKDEFEPVRASRRILRCPQRGRPPARRDVRWPWPPTGEQGSAGYGGVGTLGGRASKGWGPGGQGRDARRKARGRTRRGPQSGADHLWGAQGRRRRGARWLLRKGAAPRLIPAQHALARRCRGGEDPRPLPGRHLGGSPRGCCGGQGAQEHPDRGPSWWPAECYRCRGRRARHGGEYPNHRERWARRNATGRRSTRSSGGASTAVALTRALSPRTSPSSPCGAGLSEKASSGGCSRTGGLRCLARPSPLLLHAAEATLIHPSAWKENSAKFAPP